LANPGLLLWCQQKLSINSHTWYCKSDEYCMQSVKRRWVLQDLHHGLYFEFMGCTCGCNCNKINQRPINAEQTQRLGNGLDHCFPNIYTRGLLVASKNYHGTSHPFSFQIACPDDTYPKLDIYISELMLGINLMEAIPLCDNIEVRIYLCLDTTKSSIVNSYI
jgi:hypothetical protein